MQVWASCGAMLTAALGVFGIFAPQRTATLVGISPQGALGTAEMRATYGGLFLAMGLACLRLQQPAAFAVAAAAWIGAALLRIGSMGIDRSMSGRTIGGVLIEGAIGLLLLTGAG